MSTPTAQGKASLPKPSITCIADVRQLAQQRVKVIFAEQEALSCILDLHGATLHKRWTKKSREQRRKVLVKAFPNIPGRHRPDFEALRRESGEQIRSGTRFYDSFLLPSINLEDLVQHDLLLQFVQSRARHAPSVFATMDFRSVPLGMGLRAIVPQWLSALKRIRDHEADLGKGVQYLRDYSMLLHGRTSAADYGQLLPIDEGGNTVDSTSRSIGVPPGEGLIVLEVQERKLCFLRACVAIILHDLPIKDLVKEPMSHDNHQPNSIEECFSKNPEWPSLSTELLEAPYRVPDRLDFERLSKFVFARRSETRDHIWDLREDPSYFKKTVLDWSEHRQERIVDTNGEKHPDLERNAFLELVLWDVIVDAYSKFLLWDRLSQNYHSPHVA